MDEEVLCKKALMPCAAKNIKRKNYNAAKSVSTSQNKNKKKTVPDIWWIMDDHGSFGYFWMVLLVVYIHCELRREAPPPLEAYEKDPFDFLSINMYPAQASMLRGKAREWLRYVKIW